MSLVPEIKLLQGFCSISFGDSPENIKKTFGEPEEIQELQDEILGTSSTVFHYWDLGFSLFFDNLKNNVFSNAEIDNRDTLLLGEKLFLFREKEFIEFMKSHGYKLSDTEVHEWGEKRLSFDEAGLDCYFENNKMVSVNFGMPDPEEKFYYFPN